MPDLSDFFGSDDPWGMVASSGLKTLAVLIGLSVVCVVPLLAYYFLSLPLRRAQRALLFLDLVEQGLRAGKTLEETVVSVTATGDSCLGYRFQRVGDWIRQGTPWPEALERVPNFLPPVVVATLKAADQMGGLECVIPLCRQLMAEARSRTGATFQIFASIPWMIIPILPMVAGTLSVFVAPKYFDMLGEMGVMGVSRLHAIIPLSEALAVFQCVGGFLLIIMGISYVCGPWIRRYLQPDSLPVLDACLWWGLPWHRKRVLRTFGALLATALDAGLSESDAIRVAANAADNRLLSRKASRVIQRLSQGVEFSAALAALRQDRELGWRLANATRSRYGFVSALEGWWVSLEARAAKQHQTAAQLFSATLLLLSGLMVGTISLVYFLPLIHLIEEASLW